MNTIKTKSMITSAIILAVLFTGCSKNEKGDHMKLGEKTEEAINEAKETAKETSHKVAEMSRDAWNSFSGYTVDKKEQAATFIDKQVESLEDEIADLKESTSDTTVATKQKTAEAINALEEKRRDLALQTKKLRNATSETWDQVKNETQEKWNDFTEYLQNTKNNLKSS